MSNGVMNERGRASGSFLMALGVAVLAVGGYFAWTFLRPDPYALSERVVRDARRALAYEVREFQRALDDVVREARSRNASVEAAVDAAAAKARKDLDAVVAEAREQLADIDVELRTQRNRLDRIETRAQEAREMITEFAEETKAKARGT
jgi:chromosome segregation ATPase